MEIKMKNLLTATMVLGTIFMFDNSHPAKALATSDKDLGGNTTVGIEGCPHRCEGAQCCESIPGLKYKGQQVVINPISKQHVFEDPAQPGTWKPIPLGRSSR